MDQEKIKLGQNKKIGIMTWFQYHNYGTALQVTALSETIKNMGYEPIVIQYHAKNKPVSVCRESIAVSIGTKVVSVIKNSYYKNFSCSIREKHYNDFYDKYIRFTSRCDLLSELQLLNNELDAFVCGSDQIWAPSCFDQHYFLDFVSNDNKKIAYAPSVGLPSIEDEYIKEQIKELTSRISFLSTREESGSKIIADLIGKEVATVLDPTLLLNADEWNAFCSDICINENSEYMLVYMLGKNEWQWKEIYRIANELKLNVRVIPVFLKDKNRPGCINNPVGPAEFLSYVKNAAYVCTDSFHGLAFSVNYHKKFTVFERFKVNDKINQNSRIYNLLDLFHLRNRLFVNKSSIKMVYEQIDYNQVDEYRNIYKEKSMAFLKHSLSSATENNIEKKRTNIHTNNKLCCGCGACQAICSFKAINIKLNVDGFYSAFIDDSKCVSCGKCVKVCPYMIERNDKLIAESELYSFKSKLNEVLMKSSSGGAAHHIAKLLCDKGYTVAGCTFDVESQKSKHILVAPEQAEDLVKLQGSKYMQSDFSTISDQLYHSNDPAVIFGTPCQVAGIRSLLRARDNVIYVDLICHGVPSYHLYQKYQVYLEAKGFDITNLSVVFRNKTYGWSTRYITVDDTHNKVSTHQEKDPYFLSFEHGFCYGHNCYECPWRENSAADIRLGDYWGDRFKDDKTGVSEMVVLTDKGQAVLNQLKESEKAIIQKQDISDYTSVQQMKNGREPVFWNAYLSELRNCNKKLEDIVKYYIYPFEKRKKLKLAARKVYHQLRKVKK